MAHQAALRNQAASQGRSALLGLNAWERHKHFVANYIKFYGGQPPSDNNQTVKTDWDVLRESYRFIREEGDDAPGGWEVQLAQKYYKKLFREYAVADLSRYKEGKLGLRWRIEREVVSGKGQFTCGAKGCEERGGLASFEVNFVYEEADVAKAALVKLRLCTKHALHLNHQKNQLALQAQQKKVAKRAKETAARSRTKEEKRQKRKRRRSESSPPTADRQQDGGLVTDLQSAPSQHPGTDDHPHELIIEDNGIDADAVDMFKDMFN